MGFYHSIMDWHHPDYLPRRSWEEADRPVDGANFDRFVTYLRNDVSQLLMDYGPIGVMWFDGEWEKTWNANYGDALYALCRKLQPNLIVNNRVSVGRNGIEDATLQAGDYGTPEQTIPATGLGDQYWETCMTMNDHWGFNAADTDWKSSKTLIRNLSDIASKGGNYLLNVGPRSDGTFPPEAVERLHEIGQWMHRNGEAIYGTSASVFDTLPWGRSTTKREGARTAIYLHVFDWPADGKLVIPGLGNQPLSAKILWNSARCPVERSGSDVVVMVPKSAPNSTLTVVKLVLQGAPVVYRAPVITAPTDLIVGQTTAHISSPGAGLTVRYTVDGKTPTASSPAVAARGDVTLRHTSTIHAATFVGARRVSAVVSKTFHTASQWPAYAHRTPGLARWIIYGGWTKVPDYMAMAIQTQIGTSVDDLSVPLGPDGKPMEHIAEKFGGSITVARDGVYTFELASDDGSKLWIDGKLVVDNDGEHSTITKTGSAPLAAGSHQIDIGWFNGAGDASLSLKLGPAGGPQLPLKAYLKHR
jgi:alpha-L-fucosidase